MAASQSVFVFCILNFAFRMEGFEGWDDYAPFYDWENAQTLGRRDVPFWRNLALNAGGPDAYTLRDNLKKDRGQHESCSEGDQVFKEALAESVRTGTDEHKSPNQIRAGSEQTKQ